MDSRYWIIFEWVGAPMPSNPDHKGWTEIEGVSFESPARPFSSRDTRRCGVLLGMDHAARTLSMLLMVRANRGDAYRSVAIDIMSSDGKWTRGQFNNVSVLSGQTTDRGSHFELDYDRVQFKQIVLHRRQQRR